MLYEGGEFTDDLWQKTWRYGTASYAAAYNIGTESTPASIPANGAFAARLIGDGAEGATLAAGHLQFDAPPHKLLVYKLTNAAADGFYSGNVLLTQASAAEMTLRCGANGCGAIYDTSGDALQLTAWLTNGKCITLGEEAAEAAAMKVFSWSPPTMRLGD